jgi:hypothetical protein
MEPGSQHLDPSARGNGGANAGEEMKEKASQLTRTARERAMSAVDQQKDQVSGLLERVADTVAGDRLGGYAADYARRGADYLRRTSADELYWSVRSGLRSRPGVLLSACFVAGVAIARVMRRDGGPRWRGTSERETWRPPEEWSGRRAWPEDRDVDRDLGMGRP